MSAGAGLYLLHFDPPLAHAKHYLGWAESIDARVGDHVAGRGSKLTRAAVRRGSELLLARTWPGSCRETERRLKDRKNLRSLCPVCRPDYNAEARARMRRIRRRRKPEEALA